jgi:methionyl-tRNA formyltransferase
MADSPRLVFAGTPEFSAVHLQALLDAGIKPVAVYTQPDRPAGRGRQLQPSPVKALAIEHNIAVFQPISLKSETAQTELAELEPDLMIVVAYGLILPEAVLAIPRLGCINVHASILPRWRGAAPIQRAIQAGDTETGVTIMQMDVGLDTGAMLHKESLAIETTETAQSLHDKLAIQGSQTLVQVLPKLLAGQLVAEQQDDSLATYAHKLEKKEAMINWQDTAVQIDRNIRAFTPWPGSQAQLDDKVVKVNGQLASGNYPSGIPGQIVAESSDGIIVQCGEGHLLLAEIQFPGKRMTAISALRNSNPEQFSPGKCFLND